MARIARKPKADEIPMPTVVVAHPDIRDRVRASKRMMCRTDASGRIILTGTGTQCLAEAVAAEAVDPWGDCGIEGGDHPGWAGVQCATNLDGRSAAFHLGYFGWGEALDHARRLFRAVTALHTNSLLAEPVAMDEPGDVDVAAFLGDAELQFLGQTPGRSTAFGPGSVVRFEHDLFTSAGVDTADMVTRGLVVVAAAYMLERAGLRAEITARLYAIGSSHGEFDIRVGVKAAYEPLVLSRALYWLAHPSVLRIVLHQIGSGHGNGQTGYQWNHSKPKNPAVIQTPGQMAGDELQEWLRVTLTKCGLKVRQ